MAAFVSSHRLIACLLAVAAAGCATTPPHSLSGAAGDSLKLCAGMGISNAPPADVHGAVIGYAPIVKIDGASLMRAPVEACLSSGFGPRKGGAGSFHDGVDLYTRAPAPIVAGGDGVVEAVQTLRGYGRTILIRHNKDVETRYAHLSSYARGLKAGARVRRGELIGYSGKTGNATAVHLHYEILIDGEPKNPITVSG